MISRDFVPGRGASSPWAGDQQHAGYLVLSVLGLLAVAPGFVLCAAEQGIAENCLMQKSEKHPMFTTLDKGIYLLENTCWLNSELTVDRVRAGDCRRSMHKAEVCWFTCADSEV